MELQIFEKQQIYSWMFFVKMFTSPNSSLNILGYSNNWSYSSQTQYLIVHMKAKTNLKNQTTGKSYLIPDIIHYSLAES